MTRPRSLVSVIMPTRRPAMALAACRRLLHVSVGYPLEIVVVVDQPGALEMLRDVVLDGLRIVSTEPLSAPRAWNLGAALARGEILALGADDLWFYHGWIGETLDRMAVFPDGMGVVGFNDLAHDGNRLATHWAAHRAFVAQSLGGVLYPPVYGHFFGDNEVNERAKAADRFVWAPYAIVEHLHPAWGKRETDVVYEAKGSLFGRDRELFERRLAAGFPDDWLPTVAAYPTSGDEYAGQKQSGPAE